MKLGTVVTLPDVALAELTASAVDFVWIDLEHGALDRRDVQPLAIAARSAGAESFVRLPSASDPGVGAVLDAGVDGVVVPNVKSAVDAERVVARLRYPPGGSRGVAARRASRYRPAGGDGEPRCVVQIESEAGAAEADRIAAVEGVEALVIGCADLAAETGESLAARGAQAAGHAEPLASGAVAAAEGGESLAVGAPRARVAIERVLAACVAAEVAFGLAGPDARWLLSDLAPVAPDIAVLGADVRIYAQALAERFEEAHVCA